MKTIFSKTILAAGLLGAGLAAAPAAQAQVFVRLQQDAPVFAGPGYGYPVVDILSWNQPLQLHGCLRDVPWCDVSYGSGFRRGWVDADDLVVSRNNHSYLLYQSRSWFSYPTISFVFSSYWGNHYRHAPWFGYYGHYGAWDWRNHTRRWGERRDRERDDWRRWHDRNGHDRYGDRYGNDRHRDDRGGRTDRPQDPRVPGNTIDDRLHDRTTVNPPRPGIPRAPTIRTPIHHPVATPPPTRTIITDGPRLDRARNTPPPARPAVRTAPTPSPTVQAPPPRPVGQVRKRAEAREDAQQEP